MTLLRYASLGGIALTLAACSQDRSQPKVPETTSADTTGPRAETPGSTYSPQSNWKQPPPETPTVSPNPGPYDSNLAQDPAGRALPPTGGVADRNAMTTAMADDQILQAVHVANTGEVDQAKLAQAKAKNPRVKQFAAMMVHDHLDADAKGYDIAKSLKLTPAESSIGMQLQSEGQRTLVELRSQSGADFDRSYMDAQVKAHKDVLNAIDQQLLPNAKNNEVRAHLQTVRTKVEGHLREAQSIQASLSAR
ncbi:DUF4142 domain-containing protein [Pendulispora brunnea]|uniref:DUF4142 domain-containing protein n=1 Tax=Pendulispora brunnea TaxID=2905690 RepID=A0ABZ2K451_9BACT